MANPTNVPAGKAGEGTNVTTTSSDATTGGTAGGNTPVAPPTDAKPGEIQGGDMAQPGGESEAPVKQKYEKGYALKVTQDGHVHAGQAVKKGATIMLDMAEYRWALQNKVGVPGKADEAGYDVDSKGTLMTPENEPTLEELEAKARGDK